MTAATPETKARRRPLLAKRAVAMRKSFSMRAMWERRRAELQEFSDGDETRESSGIDSELDDLPEHI